MTRDLHATRRPRGRILGLVSLLALTVACVAHRLEDGGAQGWWAEHGPVVPHAGFPADCSLCHVGSGWTEIREDFHFDHGARTGVELEGRHAQAQCLRCHNDRGPVEVFARRGCAGCHPDPHRGDLGGDCSSCHGQEDWRVGEALALHSRTRFPLVGAHAAAACWRCHTGALVGNFARVPTDCASCHGDELAAADDPDHLDLGWTANCQDCHTPTSWGGEGFVHSAWPLTGGHGALDCSACHSGGTFAGLSTDCASCHLDDYQATVDPDHVAFGFSTDCADCHGTAAWEGASFDHGGIVGGCVDCHLEDYQGATDPDHVAFGFSTECADCHGTTAWAGATFDHPGIVSGCADCHLDDYLATSQPDHGASGFPTACEQCHLGTSSWLGAAFDHSFPIEAGPHGVLDCADCHTNPRGLRPVQLRRLPRPRPARDGRRAR